MKNARSKGVAQWINELQAGDRVCVAGGGVMMSEVITVTVERTTKTLIVLTDGRRFYRDGGLQKCGDLSFYRCKLVRTVIRGERVAK